MEKYNSFYSILIIFICCIFKSCNITGKPYQSMNNGSLGLVKNQFKKWEQNKESFFEILLDNVIWTVSGNSPVSGVYTNKKEFLEKAVNPILHKLKPPLKPVLISISVDGNSVYLQFNASAITINDGIYENTYLWKLQLKDNKVIKCVAFLDTYALNDLLKIDELEMGNTIEKSKDYIGIWVTADGNIRHELLPNNRYDEARGNRKSTYQGSYKMTGNHIDYLDDTGFTADGYFKDGILYHAGMILYKEEK